VAANAPPASDSEGVYTGWIAGGLVIAAVLGVGAIFWFMHHPFPHLALPL
jgi:hypothetical protein